MGAAQATGFYRFEAKIISRGGGRSLVASSAYRTAGKSAASAAAYRAGVQLTDERTGISYDYTKKRGIMGAEIMLPNGAPSWMQDRAKLWNAVEATEKRKDAQTARDYLLSLPHQLSAEQRRALTKWFVAEQFTSKGYVADIAWHSPDSREGLNHHAHVMVTLRRVEGNGFARTKDRAPAGVHPMKVWKDDLLRLREAWAHSANRFLEAAGLDVRITHESLKSRGIDAEPEPKIGPIAMKMERNGRESLAGKDRRDVAARNAERNELKVELAQAVAEEAQILDLVARRLRSRTMGPGPVTDEELRLQHEAELDGLAELQRQAAQDAFKRQADQAAEEAKKQQDRARQDEVRRQSEGDTPSATARYSEALADHYDVRDPFGSLAKAVMAEYGALVRSQEQLRQQIAQENDPDKRRVIELQKEIEATDYMAITSERLGGISAAIAGREDPPQAILHYARGEMYTEQGAKLRDERAAALIVLRDKEQRQQDGETPRVQPGAARAADVPPAPGQTADAKQPAAPARAGAAELIQQGAGKPEPVRSAWNDPRRDRRETRDAMEERHEHEHQRMLGTAVPPAEEIPHEQKLRQGQEQRTRADYEQGRQPERRQVDPIAMRSAGVGRPGSQDGDQDLSDAQRAKLDRLQATRAAYAKREEPEQGRVAPTTGLQPARPGEAADMPDQANRIDEKQADEKLRSKVTGKSEGDAELSDAQRAKLDKLQATRAAYAEHATQKAKDRDRGGGGRSGR